MEKLLIAISLVCIAIGIGEVFSLCLFSSNGVLERTERIAASKFASSADES